MSIKKTYFIDTNIILDSVSNIFKLSQNGMNTIMIPETCIDELDNKKSGFDSINMNARQFGRIVELAEVVSTTTIDGVTYSELELDTVDKDRIILIAKDKYEADNVGYNVDKNIINDRKILEVSKDVMDNKKELMKKLSFINEECIFLSIDIMCRVRAITLKLPVETLKGKDQKIDLEFHREVSTGYEKESINNLDVHTLDKDYIPSIFNYTIVIENGGQVLTKVKNDRLEIIDEDELIKQEVSPRNKNQKFFSSAILDEHYKIVASNALAGSGKTLLAVSGAMKLIKDKTLNYSGITYIRNSIESLNKGEEVGFLSGNDEKFEIYNFPLFDSLSYIGNNRLKKSNDNSQGANKKKIDKSAIEEEVNELIKFYDIETMWTGAMRGRTLTNRIIIIDEAQNMSAETLQLVMTRVDETCKVIVIGSNNQIDNAHTNQYINGLSVLLNATKDKHEELNMFACKLDRVLRGPITEFSERIFSKR